MTGVYYIISASLSPSSYVISTSVNSRHHKHAWSTVVSTRSYYMVRRESRVLLLAHLWLNSSVTEHELNAMMAVERAMVECLKIETQGWKHRNTMSSMSCCHVERSHCRANSIGGILERGHWNHHVCLPSRAFPGVENRLIMLSVASSAMA